MRIPVAFTTALALFVLTLASDARAGESAGNISFGKPFWQQWGDGRAELATYELIIPRYGEKRRGTAISIVVPETFSKSLRVKADRGKHPAADEFPVLKINLIEDFPTGVYDYNLMTTAFTTMAPVDGRPAGSPSKVSFSAQEWCGHAWSQFLFDAGSVRFEGHSYFDGEADESGTLSYPAAGVSEDALLLWARGWATPRVGPGEKIETPVLTSARVARFAHKKASWSKAIFSRSTKSREVTVPAGTFQADVLTVSFEAGRKWTFYVEQGGEHRVLRWETNDGEQADLIASERLKYWEMNGASFVPSLKGLGLEPRPPRTP